MPDGRKPVQRLPSCARSRITLRVSAMTSIWNPSVEAEAGRAIDGDAGRVEGDGTFAQDPRFKCVAAASRVMEDEPLLDVHDQVMKD